MFSMLDHTREFSSKIVGLESESQEEEKDADQSLNKPEFINRVNSPKADNPFSDPLLQEGSYWGILKQLFFTITLIAPTRLFLCILCLLFIIWISKMGMLGQ